MTEAGVDRELPRLSHHTQTSDLRVTGRPGGATRLNMQR